AGVQIKGAVTGQPVRAIQIVIGILILCLSASVLQVHEVHFTGDVALFLIVVTVSGSVLVHSGRRPTLFWVSLCRA
uniref:Si:dkey-81h8.1 n=1 Tax=Neolamprologus brichardi TaxID=32507 RepID=A0A3Q4MZD5_NEOBR